MKKNLLLSFGLFLQIGLNAQCGSGISGGTSSTLVYAMNRASINAVVADKNINTVAFIHRTNTLTAGGNTANLMYDISTNGGTTWTPDLGFLNPLTSSYARFPNITLYNPAGNTTPNNAYIGYMSATINTLSSAYNGLVSGVRRINGTGNTENYNQPTVNPSFIPASVVKGAPGVFWAVDGLYNGTYITGFTVYKGVWNSTSNDIVWSNNYNVSPSFNTGLTATGAAPADYNIAFDPTGTTGYISFLGHLASGPSGFAYYPVLYKTTNGGTTWTGPMTVDVTQFSCLTSNLVAGVGFASATFEHDLVVDVNGNPHLIAVMGNGNNAYAIYYGYWHHIFDITLKNGLWAAYDLGNVNAGRGTWGTAPNAASLDIFPQIARSADGTKIFYTWTDNVTYIAGAANLTPNLFSKAYNVTTDMWTPTKDFSSCNVATDGKMLFPHIAPEVLEPAGAYKLAVVYAEFSSAANDPGLLTNFKFLDNATYAVSEFSIATPPAAVAIQPGPGLIICPGSTISIGTATNVGQFLWSNGATTPSINVTTGAATSYSVIAQQGCLVGTASITVSNLAFSANVVNPNLCPGATGTFTVSGNATGYTWNPSSLTGTNASFVPTNNTVTVSGSGSGGCTTTQTVLVNILPQPTLSLAGTNTICTGMLLTQTISGAQTYVWNNSSTASTFTDMPMFNTVYTATGTAANTCTGSITLSVTVKPSPTVNIISSATVICAGQSVSFIGQGASTYSWNAVASLPSITLTPATNTVYTLTGAAVNLCENSKTIAITVNALPSITITPSKAGFCKGDRIRLTASGATTYTWVSPGVLTSSVQINPIVNTTYTVIGNSPDNCANTQTYALVVSACTGINESTGPDALMIYPNPNNGNFIIKGDVDASLSIFNELGQIVKTISLTAGKQHQIDMDGLPAGIYFITDQHTNSVIKQKIVVTR